MYEVLAAQHPMSLRAVFYRLVSLGKIEKDERAYKGVVVRLLSRLRMENRVPWDWVSDATRWMYRSAVYTDLRSGIAEFQRTYRRDAWRSQPRRVEVWCEKVGLVDAIFEVTDELGVPLMPCRGFTSNTALHNAGETIASWGKPTWILYLGDHDPSGVAIDRQVEAGLRKFAHGVEINFERVAVTPAQIRSLKLPTRPTKKSDSRAKGFKGRSVEVDAIEVPVLRQLVRERIEELTDQRILRATKVSEASELEHLCRWAEVLERGEMP